MLEDTAISWFPHILVSQYSHPHIEYKLLVWGKRKPRNFSKQDSNINKTKISEIKTFAAVPTEVEEKIRIQE